MTNEMTSREKGTFKNQARRVHELGNSRGYLEDDEKTLAKMEKLEAVLEKLEEKMNDSDRKELVAWVYDNDLYGILGTC